MSQSTNDAMDSCAMLATDWKQYFSHHVLPEISSMISGGMMADYWSHCESNYSHYISDLKTGEISKHIPYVIREYAGSSHNDEDYAYQVFLGRDFKGRVDIFKNIVANIVCNQFMNDRELTELIKNANGPKTCDEPMSFIYSESDLAEFYYVFYQGIKYCWPNQKELVYCSPLPNSQTLRYGCANLAHAILCRVELKSYQKKPQEYGVTMQLVNALFNNEYDNIIMKNLSRYKDGPGEISELIDQNDFLCSFNYTPRTMLEFIKKHINTFDETYPSFNIQNCIDSNMKLDSWVSPFKNIKTWCQNLITF